MFFCNCYLKDTDFIFVKQYYRWLEYWKSLDCVPWLDIANSHIYITEAFSVFFAFYGIFFLHIIFPLVFICFPTILLLLPVNYSLDQNHLADLFSVKLIEFDEMTRHLSRVPEWIQWNFTIIIWKRQCLEKKHKLIMPLYVSAWIFFIILDHLRNQWSQTLCSKGGK